MAHLNSFGNQFFSVSQSDLRKREERINNLFIALIDRGSDRHVLLKNNAQPEKRGVCVKNGNEGRDVLDDSRKRYHARGQR